MASSAHQANWKGKVSQQKGKIDQRRKRNNGQARQLSSNNPQRQNGPFRLSLKAVEGLKIKEPEQIVLGLFDAKFGLEHYLNADRMGEKLVHDLTFSFVKSFECNSMPTKLRELSTKIADSNFFKTLLYNSVNERVNSHYNINLIRLALKLLIEILNANENNLDLIGPLKDRLELLVLHRIPNEELKSLFENFLKVEAEITENISKRKNKTFKNIENEDEEPGEDFTTMSIVPALDDILNNQETFLRRNITNGSYKNVHHYLDVQFRLLREDFMRPLREGLSEFKEIVQKHKKGAELTKQIISKIKKIQYLNTYFDVACINVTTSGQGIVYVMQLDNEKIKSINWETSKRLIFGSLICFSSDYFINECLIGIVCERDEKDLRKKGCFNVKFDFEAREVISYPEFGKSYIMLETSAFFESYKHVLKAFQTFKREGEENFPFKENLVYCQNAMMPLPKYLKEASVDFTKLVDRKKRIQMNINIPQSNPVKCFISNPASWPSAEQMRLDESQYEAIKLALTNKLALIQGPPGTGKTFIGVKLVKFLLDNKHSWWNRPNERHKPILMICYTNHALDQFLEYCINECKLTSGVVRVGGRCKSESLEPFLLRNLKQNLKSKRQIDRTIYYNIVNQYRKISDLKDNIAYLSRTLDLIFNCQAILTIQKLNDFINPMHFDQLIVNYRRNEKKIDLNFFLIDWLGLLDFDEKDFVEQLENLELIDEVHGQFVTGLNADQDQEEESKEFIQNNEQPNLAEPDSEDEDVNFNKERILDDNLEGFTSTKELNFDTKELLKKEELYDMIKAYRHQMGYSKNGNWKVKRGKKVKDANFEKLETTLNKIFSKTCYQYSNNDLNLIENCANIWRLDYTQRHLLYFHWVNKYKNEHEERIKKLCNQYNNEINQMQELRLQEDRSIMQDAYIIAMTTTGSSRYHSILKDIGPRIIIVEEAAEVFEAHIVSALSKHCEHLILIGDHVQLRPNPAVYTLATQYHLDVSLFERLINNDTKRVMLNNQHRMRPEISVLMKHFYEETINNDPSVNSHPAVKGLKKSIYFIDHDQLERLTADSTTKSNIFEAEYLAKLSLYLTKQGYDQSKITVLTMYLGQLSEIKKRLRNLGLKLIKVSTVDNYQGEENDIILLSLVRSNLNHKIGFLSIKNRVCVALSRARHGLFVIGNFEFITESEKRDIWKSVVENVKSNNCFGRSLSLTCGSHPQNDLEVIEPKDFDKRPDGGCLLPCNFRLKCGHVCALKCHGNFDQDHTIYECKKYCDKKMERCGHLCKQICSLKHECVKCSVLVFKEIPDCGHMIKINCDTEPIRKYCTSNCEKILSCGHKCTKKCQLLDCGKCMTKINAQSPCVHKSIVTVNCSDPKWTYLTKCAIPCGEILDCGHKCNGTCGSCLGGLLHQSCVQKCDRMLFCGHKCSVPCSKQCEPCKEICQNECYHSKCKQICSEPCADCKEECKISCQHSKCTKFCHELCDRKPCNYPCDKKLKCKHDCIGLCGEKCPPLCRICHRNQVGEIFFGNEDEQDARFIYLEECSHVIEVSGMDHWINSRYSDENNNSSNSIQLPQCPKCKTPIRKSKRYANVIKTQLKAINEIKLKHFGDKTENKKIFKKLKKHLEEYSLTREDKFMDRFVIENINTVLRKDLSFNSLAAIQNTWNIYLRIKKIQKSVQENGFNEFLDQKEHFKFEIAKIFDSLKTQRNELLMLKEGQKLRDINTELDRVANIVELERMTKLALKIPNLPNEALTILSRLEDLLVKNVIRFDEVKDEVKNCLNKLAPLLKTELSKEEKSMIVKAIGLSVGHWYKCPNDHVYCIGECGGAMEKTKCPDCKAEIGGVDHQIVTGNQLASEMDGASHPAWPTALLH